jgi:YidC/Oxa1 family membrane protein insertase
MKKKIVILVLLLLTISGCTKRFTVENEDKTKKQYVSNIICKPETEELVNVYINNKDKLLVDYDKLPKCENLKINSGGYEGLWTSLFVKPLAWVIVKLGVLIKSNGLAIMIVGFLLRAVMYPLSKKSTNMSENMKKAQKDLDSLEKKYKGKEDKESMMAKSQEMMMIYKKYNIKPLSGCLFAFIQLPILLAFYEAIQRVPEIFEETFLGINMGTTPGTAIASGSWQYIIICVILVAITYLSFKLNPSMATNDAMGAQQKMMGPMMTGLIGVMSFTLPTAIGFYWITSSAFTIWQNLSMKRGKSK